jgi:hypothetical protein
VSRDGGRKQKTDLYGLSIGRWHWLNFKDYANEEEEGTDKCGFNSRYQ